MYIYAGQKHSRNYLTYGVANFFSFFRAGTIFINQLRFSTLEDVVYGALLKTLR